MFMNVAHETSRRLMHKIFGLMSVGLTLTGLTAYGLFLNTNLFMTLAGSTMAMMLLFLAQIGVVIAISGFVTRMSAGTASLCFCLYSILTGITLSSVLYIYTAHSVAATFFICAVTFAVVALYGYFTDADLTGWGSVATMALFGLIIATLINIFLKSDAFDLVISLIGVGIFTVLTAYDVQRFKTLGYDVMRAPQDENRLAVVGALALYLDFINLFIMLLRVVGRKRD